MSRQIFFIWFKLYISKIKFNFFKYFHVFSVARPKSGHKKCTRKADNFFPYTVTRQWCRQYRIVSKVYYHLRVKWSFICCFYLYLPLLFHFKTLLNPSNFKQKIYIGKKHERSKFRKASNKRPLFSGLIWLTLPYWYLYLCTYLPYYM